jgi:DNA-binding IclR family transcriptional regulator
VAAVLALIDEGGDLTRVVLELVAANEQPLETTELARRARLDRETTSDLLERARRRGILRVDRGGCFVFAGDLVRRVLRARAEPHVLD